MIWYDMIWQGQDTYKWKVVLEIDSLHLQTKSRFDFIRQSGNKN